MCGRCGHDRQDLHVWTLRSPQAGPACVDNAVTTGRTCTCRQCGHDRQDLGRVSPALPAIPPRWPAALLNRNSMWRQQGRQPRHKGVEEPRHYA
eukprot:361485-Chlamydomonas_euryale.AAC.4